MQLIDVPLTRVHPDPGQPRTWFDPAKLAELAASIAGNGLRQPPTVRPHPTRTSHYLLVMGERRWRACRTLRWATMPALLAGPGEDLTALFVAALAENINRADMTVMEEARGYQRAVNEGMTNTALAAALGKTPELVAARRDLLRLAEDVQDHVAAGRIGPALAHAMSACTVPNQRHIAARYLAGHLGAAADAAAYAKALHQREQQTVIFGQVDDDLPPAVAARSAGHRSVARELDRIAAARAALDQLQHADPADLAAALGPAAAVRLAELNDFLSTATKARNRLREAAAITLAAQPAVR